MVAEAVLSSGQVVYSAPISFQLPSSTSQTGSRGSAGGRQAAADCAEVITGLFLSPALLLPGRTKDNSAQQSKACDSGSKQVAVTVGPFREDECGQYTVSDTLWLWVVARATTHAEARMFQSRAYMLQRRADVTKQGIKMPLLPIDNRTPCGLRGV